MDTYKLLMNNNMVKAFFINLYNLLQIHSRLGYAEDYHMLDVLKRERKDFFSQYAYLVGGEIFSLNDIMHGIFRFDGNYAKSLGSKIGFKLLVNRRRVVLDENDGRRKF